MVWDMEQEESQIVKYICFVFLVVFCGWIAKKWIQRRYPLIYSYYDGRLQRWIEVSKPLRMNASSRSPLWETIPSIQPYMNRYASRVYALIANCYPDEDEIHAAVNMFIQQGGWTKEWKQWCSGTTKLVRFPTSFLKYIGASHSEDKAVKPFHRWIQEQLEILEWMKRVPHSNGTHPLFGTLEPAVFHYRQRLPVKEATVQCVWTSNEQDPPLPYSIAPTVVPTGLYWDVARLKWVWLMDTFQQSKYRTNRAATQFLNQLFRMRTTSSSILYPIEIERTTMDPVVYCMKQTHACELYSYHHPNTKWILSTRG